MEGETAIDVIQRKLRRALKDSHVSIERAEMAAAMLGAFSAPIPQYEPQFRHLAWNPKAFELHRCVKG